MRYEYLDDIAIADVAFEAWGETVDELFQAAADATMNVMVSDLDAIGDRVRRVLSLEDEALDLLLFRFLQEFIFFKDADQLLLRPLVVHIEQTDRGFILRGECCGETIDPTVHDLVVDVKAVTLHRFHVKPHRGGWQAMVILDI